MIQQTPQHTGILESIRLWIVVEIGIRSANVTVSGHFSSIPSIELD